MFIFQEVGLHPACSFVLLSSRLSTLSRRRHHYMVKLQT